MWTGLVEKSFSIRRRLTNEIRNAAIKEGADLVGVCSVENYRCVQATPTGHAPDDILPNSRHIIVLVVAGIDFPRLDRVDTLSYPGLEVKAHNYPLGTPEYNVNNTTLQCGRGGYAHIDLLAYKLARFIIQSGFAAVPIGGGHPYFQEPLHGVISHKHAAVQAGLGQIGISSLLLTPEYGPNCYLVSVLTDAPLVDNEPFTQKLCEAAQQECGLACVSKCPQKAISFEDGDSLPIPSQNGLIDKEACQKRFQVLAGAMGYYKDIHHERHHGITIHCGTCVRACPIGRLV